jgi:NAD(P)-dependent dehydrogenase (short-subunit alcohol dehydrogenase family)
MQTESSTGGRSSGKVAVVTGASSGHGRAIALALARDGAAVVCADLRKAALPHGFEDDIGTDTDDLVRGRGGKAAFIVADVTRAADLDAAAALAVAQFGRLDIWVNNAGIYPSTPLTEMSEAEWDEVVDLNLRAVFVGSREAAKKMVGAGGGGVIVNIGSLNAHFALGPGFAHYTTTKHGILGLTKALAAELGPEGIRVLAVSPQLTETEGAMGMSGAFVQDDGVREMMDMYASRTPLGRIGKPDDIARTILFAVSDLAGYMTGSELMADGGALAFG